MTLSKDPAYIPDSDEFVSDDELMQIGVCEHKGCKIEVFAACVIPECQQLLCFSHFIDSDPCDNHNVVVNKKSDTAKEVCENKNTIISYGNVMQPEQFEVEELPKQPSGMFYKQLTLFNLNILV